MKTLSQRTYIAPLSVLLTLFNLKSVDMILFWRKLMRIVIGC